VTTSPVAGALTRLLVTDPVVVGSGPVAGGHGALLSVCWWCGSVGWVPVRPSRWRTWRAPFGVSVVRVCWMGDDQAQSLAYMARSFRYGGFWCRMVGSGPVARVHGTPPRASRRIRARRSTRIRESVSGVSQASGGEEREASTRDLLRRLDHVGITDPPNRSRAPRRSEPDRTDSTGVRVFGALHRNNRQNR
jgi:hypothetical protein